jgi:PPOX class probable F420-dependent enzyme
MDTRTQASGVRPPEGYLDLLERPLFAHFATVAGDGSPRVNPMWFVWDNAAGVVKLTHTNQRHNYRYVQKNGRVALSIVDPDNGYRYLQLRGEIERVEPDPTGAFYNTLQQRYRGHTSEVKDKDVRVVLTIRPTAFKVRG